MNNNRTIFMYGPQTAGKTTRLLRIIKRDQGKDVLMSGEDKDRVNNGREVCDITLRVPRAPEASVRFIHDAREQGPVKHVLIDGAQFLSKWQIKGITKIFSRIDRGVPIIFTGCRYYIATAGQSAGEIPVSRFLMNWCDRSVPVDRTCDFCDRIATRLLIKGFKRLANNKIMAVDPHLVCDVHYRRLYR